jgi:PAS domain S-box-containing protein
MEVTSTEPVVRRVGWRRLAARLAGFLPRGGSLPEEIWRRRQRAILVLLWAHVGIVVVFGLARGFSLTHSLLQAGEVAVFAAFASLKSHSRKFISTVSALGLLTASAVLVDLSGGTVEMHFHFFVMIGVLTLYEDWLPFLVAVGFVLVHHAIVGALFPASVYDIPAARAKPLLWAGIHAFFVAAAGAVYLVAWRLNEDVRGKLAESSRRLAVSEERFRNAFANAPIGMALLDPQGRYVRVNEALSSMLGRTEDELLEASFEDLTHPDDLASSRDAWRRLRDESTPIFQREKRYVHADGHPVWALVSASAVPDAANRTTYFVAQVQDITERKIAEEALQLTMEKLQAASDERRSLLDRTVRAAEEERIRVAAELHDGPVQHLTALDLRLESLRTRLERGTARASGDSAERIQERLREEIRGLRRMMTELRPPALDERGLDAALRDYVGGVAKETGLMCSVESSMDGRLPPALDTILYRVAQEAVTNVVKHAKARDVRIALEGTNGKVQLDIRDDGVGFDVDHAWTKVGEGHFGLVGMRERVAAAGGSLRVDSRPGAGTHILVSLPREMGAS